MKVFVRGQAYQPFGPIQAREKIGNLGYGIRIGDIFQRNNDDVFVQFCIIHGLTDQVKVIGESGGYSISPRSACLHEDSETRL